MTPIERDDFLHALTQTLGFYGKEIDRMQTSFWVDACRDRPIEKLKKSFREHIKTGKYAPRPADILTLCDGMKSAQRGNALPPPPEPCKCPAEIAHAWSWFMGRTALGSQLEGLFSDQSEVDAETQEKYLHIVNHEAHKFGTPEAIPDEFKLQEVWG